MRKIIAGAALAATLLLGTLLAVAASDAAPTPTATPDATPTPTPTPVVQEYDEQWELVDVPFVGVEGFTSEVASRVCVSRPFIIMWYRGFDRFSNGGCTILTAGRDYFVLEEEPQEGEKWHVTITPLFEDDSVGTHGYSSKGTDVSPVFWTGKEGERISNLWQFNQTGDYMVVKLLCLGGTQEALFSLITEPNWFYLFDESNSEELTLPDYVIPCVFQVYTDPSNEWSLAPKNVSN